MRNKTLFTLVLAVPFLFSSPPPARAVEAYLLPPFELTGSFDAGKGVEAAFKKADMIWHKSGLDRWNDITIKVYRDHFSGYSRWQDPKGRPHMQLLTVSGVYDRGYLIGTWEMKGVFEIDDKLNPYDQVYTGSGTFYSGLITHAAPVPVTIRGSAEYSHGVFGPGSTPEKPNWEEEILSVDFGSFTWDGEVERTSCEDTGDSEYVGRRIDSGATIESVSGIVEVLRCGADADAAGKDAWDRAVPGMKLYVEDHVRTLRGRYDSAIVRFADYNRFTMKPDTEIVVKKPPERKGRWELVFGKLWKNAHDIITTGEMEIETSQAVAGIKGTEFEISFDGKTTELKVADGLVSLTSNFSGQSVDIGAGQSATADYGDISALSAIDAAALKADWEAITAEAKAGRPAEEAEDTTAREAPGEAPTALAESAAAPVARDGKKNGFAPFAGAAAAVVIILTLVVVYLRKK